MEELEALAGERDRSLAAHRFEALDELLRRLDAQERMGPEEHFVLASGELEAKIALPFMMLEKIAQVRQRVFEKRVERDPHRHRAGLSLLDLLERDQLRCQDLADIFSGFGFAF